MVSDIIVFIFILLFVWLGYRAGFIKTLLGMCSYFISIILGLMLYPLVSKFLENSALYDAVLKFSEKRTSVSIEGDFFINEILQNAESHVATSIAELLINIISFVLVILICKIVIAIISKSLNFLSKVPVISFFNRILGAAAGGLKGIVLLYILFLLINFLPANITSKAFDDINNSTIAHKFYRENLIIDVLGKDIVNQ